MKLSAFIFLLSGFFISSNAWSDSTPSSLKLKVYKFAISANTDCTNLITVFEDSNPTYVEFTTGPEVGSGSIPDGTYPCIAIDFADVIKFTPSQNEGGECVAGVEYSLDVCNANSSQTFTLSDGTSGTCQGNAASPIEQRVTMYISTASTSAGGNNAFNPPTSSADANNGLNLGNALVVRGSSVGEFRVDATNAVTTTQSQPGVCDMQPPTFTFTTI